jgi:hypothetical protein
VTFYHLDPVIDPRKMDRLPEVYPRRRAYLDESVKGGQVWMIETFGDPTTQGSMAIFRSRDAAEKFIENDPFTLEGSSTGPSFASGIRSSF